MKKILFTLLFFGLISCSLEDDAPTFHLEYLKAESVTIPESFVLGETYEIKVAYKRPTSCHSFHGFYYDKNLNIRTVAVQCIVAEKNCNDLVDDIQEETLNFYVTNNGTYIFKFWQGLDENGEDVFLEYEIPVLD